ncbi:S-adenosyl-L-methionine-dependent methyltransferase [Boletus edulis BED1]|uniref:S-adenosyl-L-methionine-dependent methyltransferase n=1 Tax=Boletus edulis BED1 TaxID=1328754 RepID=A0AAD4BYZ6_BOLED|nr:S-adenosyl-L-methionine-dependent methyltransferase [Boletus edulis BED1]
MSGEAQLEALLEIINTSARQAIVEYKKDGNEVPTIHSKTYHPIDFANDTVALKKAVRLLEGACQQLCASLAPPQHTVQNYAMSFEWACIGVVIRAKVADVLEKYPKGLHVDELAKLVNLEKGKLARVLRLLATKGCFTEGKPAILLCSCFTSGDLSPTSVTSNTFANNRISLITLSTSNPGALSRIEVEDVSEGAVVLYETMREPEYATSYDPDKSPLVYALKKKGFKGTFFDWMKVDNYHRAMVGISDIMGSLSVLHHYPWNEVKTVCDVGASVGTVSLPLSKIYPHLKIINQDLPEVLVLSKDIWARDAPEALKNNQVAFVPLNFFEESPVQGQDVYYLRNIIHDWPDSEATVIMRSVRSAMAPHSRLLIHDYVLRSASRDRNAKSFGADVAPEPLLPNFGNGNNRNERTLDESIALGSAAGLRLEKVYDLAESAVLEFRVAA